MISNFYCPGNPTFFKIFDLSYAPSLIFYAYIPVIIASLFFGVFVLIKDKYSIQSKLLFLVAIFFSLWNLNVILEWITVPVNFNMFFWQITMFLEMLIFLMAVYFAYVFLNKKDINIKTKLILSTLGLPVVFFLPTTLNIKYFDVLNCQGMVGFLTHYVYLFEIAAIVWVGVLSISKLLNTTTKAERNQTLIFTIGTMLLLIVFSLSNILGEITQVYQVNLFGPIGMVIFLGLMVLMIVRYKTFNIKLLGAQALTVTLWVLVGSLFFLSQNMTNRIVTGVTFLLAVVFGVKLMQSVKREVEQRERIEKLAEDLSAANEKLRGLDKLKSEFLSLASHQLRSPLTAIKGYTSMLLEGTFGQLQEQQREINVRILESSQSLISMIEDFLNVSKIEQGGMQYAFAPTDLSKMVSTLFAEMKISAENKHLEFKLEMEEGSTFMANVDAGKLKQVFMNLIDNSIKYTPNGFVRVSLVRDKNKNTITFAVKDSGVGVSPETKDKLFQKFSRGEGGKLNTGGSGLGLYLAQEITKAHKGEIAIGSEGLGKGSTFAVTLPAVVE